ncbi:MAG: HEAT repeat domain-containing protein, partial [Planctomycetes bacterium]|nr:HEAT repeat domain-containing protein [Planctomycetota bacterium]
SRNDPETAVAATEALLRAGKPIDLAALLNGDSDALKNWALNRVTNGHGKDVPDEALLPLLQDPNMGTRRSVVIELGGRVSVAAVPELIRLLRDPTQAVRDAASDALTKIRFFHEQQAHWDRVFKGIDASATSAAEKLLLQAKPGQPKAQRLLAITSLGTLGVPEALPFLIDWTTDPDAEIAASAKAVITEIHLHPRR